MLSWALFLAVIFVFRPQVQPLALARDGIAWIRTADTTTKFCTAVIVAYLMVNLVRISLLPPLNIDSYLIHLARVYHWFFDDHISVIPNYTQFTNALSPNVHIIMTSWLKVVGSDALIEIVSLLSYAGLYVSTAGIFERLGVRRASASAGALFVLSMPVLVVTSITTQVDGPTLFLLSLTVYFVLGAVRSPDGTEGLLVGLSTGMLAGAKPQGVILGGLALGLTGLVFLRGTKRLWRIGASGLAFLCMAAPGYVFNKVTLGVWISTTFPAVGASLPKFWANVSHDYPLMAFYFPFALTAKAWGRVPAYFDHDESNYGIGFVLMLLLGLAGIAGGLRGRGIKEKWGPSIVAAIGASFLFFMAVTWREEHFQWEVRVLSYAAYLFLVLAVYFADRWVSRPPVRRICVTYALGMMIAGVMLDSRAGVATVVRAIRTRPQDRTFSRLSIWDNRPSGTVLVPLESPAVESGNVLLLKRWYAGEGLAFMAGVGPRRRVFYHEIREDPPIALPHIVASISEFITERKCRWIIVDASLWTVRHYLDASPNYSQIAQDELNLLYHVNNGRFGLAEAATDLRGSHFTFNARGWYAFEESLMAGRVRTGRWMGPTGEVWWHVPEKRDLRLRLQVPQVNGAPVCHTSKLKFSVNGRPVTEVATGLLRNEEVPLEISADTVVTGTNHFTFQCDQYRRSGADAPDQRKLCVFVEKITLEQVVTSSTAASGASEHAPAGSGN